MAKIVTSTKLDCTIECKDLEKGVEFVVDPDEGQDSADESFDDEIFNNFKEDMMDLDGKKARFCSGASMPFKVLKETMESITPEGLIKKEILVHGTGGLIPDKSTILMHYEAFVEERKEPFDSSRLRMRPFKFLFGDGNVLPGLEKGIQTMKKGEISRFIVGPEYAFGPMGCPPRIPGGAEILYEVEILNCYLSKDIVEFEDMAPEEQKKAPFEKIVGVYECETQMASDLFRRKIYKPAIARYLRVKNLLEDVSVENEESDEKRKSYLLKVYLNLSQCYLNVQNPKKAITFANLALKFDPDSPKGLYRLGYALHMINEYERAEYFLNRARMHKPYEKTINAALQKLEQKRKMYQNWELSFCKKAFNAEPKESKKPVRSQGMQEFYDIVENEVRAFVDSDEKEFVFSAGYTDSQLDIVKEIAQYYNLAFISKIMGDQKINKVAKK